MFSQNSSCSKLSPPYTTTSSFFWPAILSITSIIPVMVSMASLPPMAEDMVPKASRRAEESTDWPLSKIFRRSLLNSAPRFRLPLSSIRSLRSISPNRVFSKNPKCSKDASMAIREVLITSPPVVGSSKVRSKVSCCPGVSSVGSKAMRLRLKFIKFSKPYCSKIGPAKFR